MEFKDWLTFALALWGAGLSTVLGWVKLGEYRRSLKIYLEWEGEEEICSLIIVNLGQRPVTIQRIIARNNYDGSTSFTVLEGGQEGVLPITLTYGESATVRLSKEVGKFAYYREMSQTELDILVYDSEGNEYITALKESTAHSIQDTWASRN